MNINEIIIQIATKGSIYDEIMDTMIRPRLDLKPELLSEISISYLENGDKIEKIYEKGYFLYYFTNTVKNQVHSSTSPFHKNIRIKNYIEIDGMEFPDLQEELDAKINMEEKLSIVEGLYNDTKKTWFEDRMWQEYFTNNKSFREIEKEYSIDHCLVFHNVKKIKDKIKKKIETKK